MIPAWTLAMMESAQAAPSFTPLDLGAKLIAWWKPPVSGENVTLNGSAIASWTDEVGGYDLSQATAANQPVLDATGWSGGGPCAEFDGSNDSLNLTPTPAAFPVGSDPSEVWLACRQDADAGADTAARIAFTYGSNAGADARFLRRTVVSGVNRGDATTDLTPSVNTNVDFSGERVVRGVFSATEVSVEIDEDASTPGSITPNTGDQNVRVGTRFDGSTGFWSGAIREVVVTEPLTAQEAASLYAWLNGGS